MAIDVREFEALLRGARGDSLGDPFAARFATRSLQSNSRNRAQTANWVMVRPARGPFRRAARRTRRYSCERWLRRSFDFDLVVAARPVDHDRSAPSDDENTGDEKPERAEVVGRAT